MAPVVRRDRAETSVAPKTMFGPQKWMALLRFLEIIAIILFSQRPIGVMTQAMVVERAVLFDFILRTRQSRVDFGHRSGSPETL